MERNWYSIVMRDGEKVLTLNSWTLYGNSLDSDICKYNLYEDVEFPLAEMVRGDAGAMLCKRFETAVNMGAEDLTEEEARELFDNYYGHGSPGTHLPYGELTMDTPCGNYWC